MSQKQPLPFWRNITDQFRFSKGSKHKLILHIGMQKAGSSALQSALFSNWFTQMNPSVRPLPTQHGFTWHLDFFVNNDLCKYRELSKHLQQYSTILSWEGAYKIDQAEIEQLAKFQPDVFFYVRPLDQWLNSYKNQLIRAYRVSFDDIQKFDIRKTDALHLRNHLEKWNNHLAKPVVVRWITPDFEVVSDFFQLNDLALAQNAEISPNSSGQVFELNLIVAAKYLLSAQSTETLSRGIRSIRKYLLEAPTQKVHDPKVWFVSEQELDFLRSNMISFLPNNPPEQFLQIGQQKTYSSWEDFTQKPDDYFLKLAADCLRRNKIL